ncbi:tetratricopeptide repeat protein [Streptomyces chartreusis]|uniref:tetratricopeptide repeat protein n=1 Tax=Streptomyces chartreusis TaxID=1969 RepID=UPI0033AE1605
MSEVPVRSAFPAATGSAAATGPFTATALCVVCESYEGTPASRRLAGAREQMLGIAERLRHLGFAVRVIGQHEDPDLAAFKREKEEWRAFWRREGGNGPALILWSGHGELVDGRDLRLVLGDLKLTGSPSERTMRLREHGVTAQQLVDTAWASDADQVLLLVDTCHAGAGLGPGVETALEHLGQTSLPEGRSKWLGAMASCRASELSEGYGPLLEAVARALAEGPRTDRYLSVWSVHNELVTGADLMAAVRSQWDADGQTPQKVTVGDERPAFPNPMSEPGAPAALVEHLVLAARGVGHREEGWFFTGRRRVLGRIVDWMEAGDPGLFLVTGPAGCGKSAVLGRIATLADPRQRQETLRQGALREGDPDPGGRDPRFFAAVHLRGLDALRAARELAARLRLDEPRSVDAFRAALRELPVPPVVVLDGLDEVPAEHTQKVIEELVFPLSRMVPVLVGSRERPFRSRLADGETLPRALGRYIGSGVVTVDLEREPDTRADIAAYVRRRCEAAKVDGSRVAGALAERATEADGGFLFARLVTGFLIARLREGVVREADLLAGLPESVEAAFEEDLRSGPVRVRADGTELPSASRDLLTALAWAAGSGVPAGGVWEAVASALGSAAYDESDVDWVLSAYGRYIVEDGAEAQAVYRLYHREFVSHLRGRGGPGGVDAGLVVCRTVVDLVRGDARVGDWSAVDPYLLIWLPRHAVWAGEPGVDLLRELVEWDGNALPYLGIALHDLATFLSADGQLQAALKLSGEAAELFLGLASTDLETHGAVFASALFNVAAVLNLTGAQQAAVDPLTMAVGIHRELARTSPEHLPDLAASLNTLGVLLGQAGDDRAALETCRESVAIRRELARADPAAHHRELATALNNLSIHLSHAGDSRAALTAAREAVQLHSGLAEADPSAHLPGLAAALHSLAGRLADNGEHRAALETADRAVRIQCDLARDDPAAHLAELAASVHSFAMLLADNGDHPAALTAARQAAGFYTRLARTDPAAHLAGLAQALNNLAIRLAENGDLQGAIGPARESVRIERELARINPAAHLPGLATSLTTLASRLARNGDRQAAVEIIEEAVEIRRELAESNPAAHLPDLAMALNNLASHLSQNGYPRSAVEPAQESVGIRRELAESNPAAHLPGLAFALNNLASHLANTQDASAALETTQECVRIKRELARAHPAAHLPGLAGTLCNLASRLAESGDREAALATAREAVHLYTELTGTNRAAHLPDFAMALNNLANHLADNGDHPAALATSREAVHLYTELTGTNRAAHLPGLAQARYGLALRLAENGDDRAAVGSARESFGLRLELVRANLAAHFSGLVTSLNGLADQLARSGDMDEALRLYSETAAAIARDDPDAGRSVECECGSFLLRLPDRASKAAGLEWLIGVLVGPPEETRGIIAEPVRDKLRAFTQETPDQLHLFEEVWRHTTATAPPDWVRIPAEILTLVDTWTDAATWPESHAIWTRHAEVLSSDEASAALAERALFRYADQHIALRRQILSEGAAPVFRRLHVEDTVLDWVDCEPWSASQLFFQENADFLLDEHADTVLEDIGSAAHIALVRMARTEGIDTAYQRVQDRESLQQYVERAVAEGDAAALTDAAALELDVHGDELSSLAHAKAALLLTGEAEAADPDAPVADAPPETRARLLTELAALSSRPGQDPASWLRLIQTLIQPRSGA